MFFNMVELFGFKVTLQQNSQRGPELFILVMACVLKECLKKLRISYKSWENVLISFIYTINLAPTVDNK